MSEWISIEDRLPEAYTPVVCLVEDPYDDDALYVTAGVMHETFSFYVFNEDGEADTELRAVTHWMPLPDPPSSE